MKRLALTLCLALAAPALADDAGVAAAPAITVTAPVITAPAPAPAPTPAPSLDVPTEFVKIIFTNVKSGNWWGAAAALLVLVVALLRTYGKKLHDWLPDNLIWDVPLKFLFDTKAGGLVMNVLTATGGGMGTALLAGEPVTWALLKPILIVAGTGSALWEIGKDLYEWIKAKGAPKKPDAVPAPPSIPPVA